jgi:trimeric autotransporter adhesin
MKIKSLLKPLLLISGIALALSITGCSGGSTTGTTLSSIALSPSAATSIAISATQQFSAIGTYSDSSTQDISSDVTWASSNTGVATVSSAGLATAVAAGTTNITATLSGVTSAAVSLTVNSAPTLTSIVITPSSANISVGSSQSFQAVGTYSDGSTQALTSQITWASSNKSVAAVSSSGLASAAAPGNTNITAALSGVTSLPVTLTVSAIPTLVSIIVAPVSPVYIPVGNTRQFGVVGIYSDGSIEIIQSGISWASSDNTIATVVNGQVTAVSAGNCNITATVSGVSSSPVMVLVVTS